MGCCTSVDDDNNDTRRKNNKKKQQGVDPSNTNNKQDDQQQQQQVFPQIDPNRLETLDDLPFSKRYETQRENLRRSRRWCLAQFSPAWLRDDELLQMASVCGGTSTSSPSPHQQSALGQSVLAASLSTTAADTQTAPGQILDALRSSVSAGKATDDGTNQRVPLNDVLENDALCRAILQLYDELDMALLDDDDTPRERLAFFEGIDAATHVHTTLGDAIRPNPNRRPSSSSSADLLGMGEGSSSSSGDRAIRAAAIVAHLAGCVVPSSNATTTAPKAGPRPNSQDEAQKPSKLSSFSRNKKKTTPPPPPALQRLPSNLVKKRGEDGDDDEVKQQPVEDDDDDDFSSQDLNDCDDPDEFLNTTSGLPFSAEEVALMRQAAATAGRRRVLAALELTLAALNNDRFGILEFPCCAATGGGGGLILPAIAPSPLIKRLALLSASSSDQQQQQKKSSSSSVRFHASGIALHSFVEVGRKGAEEGNLPPRTDPCLVALTTSPPPSSTTAATAAAEQNKLFGSLATLPPSLIRQCRCVRSPVNNTTTESNKTKTGSPQNVVTTQLSPSALLVTFVLSPSHHHVPSVPRLDLEAMKRNASEDDDDAGDSPAAAVPILDTNRTVFADDVDLNIPETARGEGGGRATTNNIISSSSAIQTPARPPDTTAGSSAPHRGGGGDGCDDEDAVTVSETEEKRHLSCLAVTILVELLVPSKEDEGARAKDQEARSHNKKKDEALLLLIDRLAFSQCVAVPQQPQHHAPTTNNQQQNQQQQHFPSIDVLLKRVRSPYSCDASASPASASSSASSAQGLQSTILESRLSPLVVDVLASSWLMLAFNP